MIRRSLLPLLLLGGALPLAAQDASVTLFRGGRTLVRQMLSLNLPVGTSTHTLPFGAFDPATFTVLEPGVQVSRLTYDPATSEEALLRRAIGQRFTWHTTSVPRGTGTAVLIGLDPERWLLEPEDRIVFGRPGVLQWPTELVPAQVAAEVEVASDRARMSLPVMYQTSGGAWSAHYRFFIGSTTRVEGAAQLQSGRLALTNADVQLLAGDIGAPQARGARAEYDLAVMAAAPKMEMTSEERVGDVHLYTIPGRVTFIPGSQTVVPLFAPVAASAMRRYTVAGALGWYGGIGQYNGEEQVPVAVTWRLDRTRGTAFGDLPLPAGDVSIFDVDRSGRAQLIGQGGVGHTAAGASLEVQTGTAFDLTAKRTQTEFTTTRGANGRTIATVGYSVELSNAGESPVTIDVLEQRQGEWSVLTSSIPGERRSTTLTSFSVPVPARGSATLTYQMRVVW